jgi:ABC-type nitrate/sulfonate/bicarbonate transport system permease component
MTSKLSVRIVAMAPRLLAIALMLAGWEIAAHLAPKTPLAQTAIVPSFEDIFGPALLGMADYWKFPFWAPVTSAGGEQTLHGAVLALAYHSLLTFFRLATGLGLGILVGVGLGLATAWSPLLRQATLLPLSIFRMVPLLAMIPLFQFWVGTNSHGVIAFVAIGTGSVFVVGTINAVGNVPARYLDFARTLGTPPLAIYARVVFPAILPELWSSLLLSLGLAWSAVMAGEYVGIDTGLGRILTFAQFMSQTGRMALIAILVTFYAGLSYLACHALARRVLAWQPTQGN